MPITALHVQTSQRPVVGNAIKYLASLGPCGIRTISNSERLISLYGRIYPDWKVFSLFVVGDNRRLSLKKDKFQLRRRNSVASLPPLASHKPSTVTVPARIIDLKKSLVHSAATMIQGFWRVVLAKRTAQQIREFRSLAPFSIKIQKVWRGYQSRKLALLERILRRTRIRRRLAILKIERWWYRIHSDISQYHLRRSLRLRARSQYLADKTVTDIRRGSPLEPIKYQIMRKAAVMIQSLWRGVSTRAFLAKAPYARLIQSAWRYHRHIDDLMVEALKRELVALRAKAAVKLQSAWRGKVLILSLDLQLSV